MKYLETPQTKLFQKHGVFFAFGKEQFNEQKQPDVKYYSLVGGMLCPQDNFEAFTLEHIALIKKAISEDIAENTIEGIIERELSNHEAYYTGNIESTVDALDMYNITEEQVNKVFRNKNTKLYDTAK